MPLARQDKREIPTGATPVGVQWGLVTQQQVDYRHPWPVRIWHWANATAVIVLLLTGLLVFDIHPRLYWGDDGHEGMPAWAALSAADLNRAVPQTDLQIGSRHWDVTGVLGSVIDDGFGGKYLLAVAAPEDWDFGATRGWHFAFAWILAFSLLFYGLYLLASGRLAKVLLPVRSDLTMRSVAHEIWQHLRLRRARGEAARSYNLLQKVSYLVVIFILIPTLVLSGLTMSNAMTAAYPDLFVLFGGRQSARSIHFLTAMLLVLFVLVHVFQVFVAGFSRLMRSMITGRYVVDREDSV
jgi:thiosulfate reductase cytochrome b subunit